jgi:CRISPR-associated protein Cmr6
MANIAETGPGLAITQRVSHALKTRACDSWNLQLDKLSFKRNGEAAAKTESLKAVLETYKKARATHLRSACDAKLRWLKSLESQITASRFRSLKFINESRLLVHLGRASVLENVGLYCDRVTGLPWIPGTSLKGVLSTWAYWEGCFGRDGTPGEIKICQTDGTATGKQLTRSWIAKHGADKSDLAMRILGDDSLSGSKCAGEIVFVGGFPADPPVMGLDIVNPHFEPDGKDASRLRPNTFLTIEPGTGWQFAFYARSGVPDAERILKETTRWLMEALTQLGVGAKTAAGYGRFGEAAEDDHKTETDRRAITETEEKLQVERTGAQKELKSDYPNEASFKNAVLRPAGSRGQWNQLQKEIPKLQKPENAQWLERFKKETAGGDHKELRKQPWYPK